MVEVAAEDAEEQVDKVEEDMSEEVVGEAVAHMKTELTYHMSPGTLRIQSGLHYQTVQGRGSLRTRCAHRYWQIKRGAPTTSSVSSEKDKENWLISQIITGVQNSSRNEPSLEGGVTHLPTNGSRAQVSAANRSSNTSNRNDTEEQSLVIYDHLGKLVLNT